ncbi:hypothetical protein [Halobacillus salinus]|uniref:hypothetical protein n=1 Tax=Halobacillus salinus TaxID=192814 RepID=UPI0009A5C7EB|nr:hypothetical protein [Halobacillus salinus]
MKVSIIIIAVVSLIALVLTLLVAGKSDDNYSSSTKKHLSALTAIYVVAIAGALIALGIFIIS